MRQLSIAIISAFILTGCATQNETQYTWVKSKATNQEKEHTIADSACTAEAYKAIPNTTYSESSCNGLTGFQKGFCQADTSKKGKEAVALRTKIYDGCMLNKGWEKQPAKQ